MEPGSMDSRLSPEAQKNVEFEKNQIALLREAVHGMAQDFRNDQREDGVERYGRIKGDVRARLISERARVHENPEDAQKEVADIMNTDSRLDAEVAKQFVMELADQDKDIRKRHEQMGSENGEVTLVEVLKQSAKQLTTGEHGRDRALSSVRREIEKRLGHYLPPTDQEINNAIDRIVPPVLQSSQSNQKTPEAHP